MDDRGAQRPLALATDRHRHHHQDVHPHDMHMVTCEYCGERFYPDRLIVHHRVCGPDAPRLPTATRRSQSNKRMKDITELVSAAPASSAHARLLRPSTDRQQLLQQQYRTNGRALTRHSTPTFFTVASSSDHCTHGQYDDIVDDDYDYDDGDDDGDAGVVEGLGAYHDNGGDTRSGSSGNVGAGVVSSGGGDVHGDGDVLGRYSLQNTHATEPRELSEQGHDTAEAMVSPHQHDRPTFTADPPTTRRHDGDDDEHSDASNAKLAPTARTRSNSSSQ
ncbi:hypothetical protein PTSG_07918 [Salpingoeca rosetta]|uniref:Uncharacterized protein n=1 Tax=Salpingoeca rosetta (strain ATCC 50818 / BSB-021) TaxID=946362 RepID=F2UGP9_SALR5|nr:uncharacterized protein PTSG_07918 [Salpingoeca rosetta]EGD75799.1 hypothetical protein PTSG_07918 [Salpingoeca rosetta]|eukprot:XP_004991720.1 hypothetical protein PTSG_07918 [Salpingoeca rosetta]